MRIELIDRRYTFVLSDMKPFHSFFTLNLNLQSHDDVVAYRQHLMSETMGR